MRDTPIKNTNPQNPEKREKKIKKRKKTTAIISKDNRRDDKNNSPFKFTETTAISESQAYDIKHSGELGYVSVEEEIKKIEYDLTEFEKKIGGNSDSKKEIAELRRDLIGIKEYFNRALGHNKIIMLDHENKPSTIAQETTKNTKPNNTPDEKSPVDLLLSFVKEKIYYDKEKVTQINQTIEVIENQLNSLLTNLSIDDNEKEGKISSLYSNAKNLMDKEETTTGIDVKTIDALEKLVEKTNSNREEIIKKIAKTEHINEFIEAEKFISDIGASICFNKNGTYAAYDPDKIDEKLEKLKKIKSSINEKQEIVSLSIEENNKNNEVKDKINSLIENIEHTICLNDINSVAEKLASMKSKAAKIEYMNKVNEAKQFISENEGGLTHDASKIDKIIKKSKEMQSYINDKPSIVYLSKEEKNDINSVAEKLASMKSKAEKIEYINEARKFIDDVDFSSDKFNINETLIKLKGMQSFINKELEILDFSENEEIKELQKDINSLIKNIEDIVNIEPEESNEKNPSGILTTLFQSVMCLVGKLLQKMENVVRAKEIPIGASASTTKTNLSTGQHSFFARKNALATTPEAETETESNMGTSAPQS